METVESEREVEPPAPTASHPHKAARQLAPRPGQRFARSGKLELAATGRRTEGRLHRRGVVRATGRVVRAQWRLPAGSPPSIRSSICRYDVSGVVAGATAAAAAAAAAAVG
ncbi:MAG: hypothetical protein M1826_001557 [Phylliscum demangeonii]|nr:MAG: hypothetical protein M1826_001557 [Phylliscum demangeonii]